MSSVFKHSWLFVILQNKQTDRQLLEQLHQDLTKLQSKLKHVGYHSEGAGVDPATLKSQLEHKNIEIISKVCGQLQMI